MTDDQLTQRIRQDKIDILIDCAGHMGGNRLGVFAGRAAPVQVSAFGYPCTSGLKSIDYRMTDNVTDNNLSQKYYTEKLLFTDTCFCTFATPSDAPDTGPLPALKNGFITFGSLHTTSRLNRAVIELWAVILNKIKSSHLIIFRTTLTRSVINRLNSWFRESAVDLSKIEYLSEIPQKGYLDIYNRIDCQLDTFPWSGHTTACESLWMGVPVITLCGDRYASRMVSSVLYHCGMKEWICGSKEEYVQKAINAAYEIEKLKKTRTDLRSEVIKSELMNNARYTEEIEKQYRKIWIQYCNSQISDL
jgi:protein O-GlcNAc transferase